LSKLHQESCHTYALAYAVRHDLIMLRLLTTTPTPVKYLHASWHTYEWEIQDGEDP